MAQTGLFELWDVRAGEDGFSFGTSRKTLRRNSVLCAVFLGGLTVVAGFGGVKAALPFCLFAAVAASLLAVGEMCSRRSGCPGDWIPSWGADRDGLLLRGEYSFKTRRIPWSEVAKITLMDSYCEARRALLECPPLQRNVAVIELHRAPEPLDWMEWLESAFSALIRCPRNVVVKGYGGTEQREVGKWLGRVAPISVAIEARRDMTPEECSERLDQPPEPLVRCYGDDEGSPEDARVSPVETAYMPPTERLARWMPVGSVDEGRATTGAGPSRDSRGNGPRARV